jgi:hypothetical protein
LYPGIQSHSLLDHLNVIKKVLQMIHQTVNRK